MSPVQPAPEQLEYPPICAGVVAANTGVCMDGVNPILRRFLVALGPIHTGLFGQNAVVTSGRDEIHVASSKHYSGDAIDLRIVDKTGRDQMAYILV